MIRCINYGDVIEDKKNTKYEVRCNDYYSFYELRKGFVLALSHSEVIDNATDKVIESNYMSFYANEHYIFGEDMYGWFFSPETAIGAKHPSKDEEDTVIKLYEQYVKDTRDDVINKIIEIV